MATPAHNQPSALQARDGHHHLHVDLLQTLGSGITSLSTGASAGPTNLWNILFAFEALKWE